MQAKVFDHFSNKAIKLRRYFDQQFADPSQTDSKRFVWDYWHVPDQYTLVRTPAYHYFPENLYMSFHRDLVSWGRKHLGCWDITPPWLSYYVEGCRQELHADLPHGPWAFVYSLTPASKKFVGGETLLLRPEVLDYWRNIGNLRDRESSSYIEKVPSKFNRLIVFDPRIPHGVSEVRGTHDPREARLVIHGWFTQPKTYIDGYHSKRRCESVLEDAFTKVLETCDKYDPFIGTLSLGIQVTSKGEVFNTKFMTNNLVSPSGQDIGRFSRKILAIYKELQFGSATGPTWITVPLLFS